MMAPPDQSLASAAPLYAALGTLAVAAILGGIGLVVRMLAALGKKAETQSTQLARIETTLGSTGDELGRIRAWREDAEPTLARHDVEIEHLHRAAGIARAYHPRSDR